MISGAVVAHAGFQLVAWLYILPVSIFIARNKYTEQPSDSEVDRKESELVSSVDRDSSQQQVLIDDIEATRKGQAQGEQDEEEVWWLRFHKKMNALAMYAIIIAILIIVIDHRAMASSNDGDDGHSHRRLSSKKSTSLPHIETGWTLFSLVCVQAFVGIKRPAKDRMPQRSEWKMIHQSLGYFILPLFVVWQITTGLMKSNTDTIILVVSIFVPILIVLYLATYYYLLKFIKA